jgi:hypothetical protein
LQKEFFATQVQFMEELFICCKEIKVHSA